MNTPDNSLPVALTQPVAEERWRLYFNKRLRLGHKGQRYLASGHAHNMLRAGASMKDAVAGGLKAANLWPVK